MHHLISRILAGHDLAPSHLPCFPHAFHQFHFTIFTLFLQALKTYLLHKAFPPRAAETRRSAFMEFWTFSAFLVLISFIFSFGYVR